MEFRVSFKHMASSLATYAYAEKKLGARLEKYAPAVIDAHLIFAVEHGVNLVTCHFLAAGGIDLTVECEDEFSMNAAIDGLSDKLAARLQKKTGKMRDRRPLPPLAAARAEQGFDLENSIDAGAIL